MKLDWYKDYWINSTKTIDYAIDSLWEEGGVSKIRLKRIGLIPMPMDVQLTLANGERELHYVPLDLQFGEKPVEDTTMPRKVYEPWKWTHATYVISTSQKLNTIRWVEIDPSQRLADIERKNNQLKLDWSAPVTPSVK